MEDELKWRDWWWSSNVGDWKDITRNWKNALWSEVSYEVPHPAQGTNYFQITGNKYLRKKLSIKFGLQQTGAEDVTRVVIYKNKGHISNATVNSEVFTGGTSPFFAYYTSQIAFPCMDFLANNEILYDNCIAKGASVTKFFIFEDKTEEVLDINSPYGLISIIILPGFGQTASTAFLIEARTYFQG